MRRCPTIFLRCAVFVAGAAIIGLCIGITWMVLTEWNSNLNHQVIMAILLAGIYSSAIPFFIALYQALKLLGYIDTNRAFSDLSAQALKIIMYCAGIIFIVCTTGGLPFFYYWAELDDAPGLVLIGMAISGAAFVIAMFASVLRRLFQEAIEIKNENDFTV